MTSKRWYLMVLLNLLCGIALIHGQNPVKLHYNNAIIAATEGNFVSAADEFEKTLEANPYYSPASLNLKVLADLKAQKLNMEAVRHYFKAIDLGNRMDFDGKIVELTEALKLDTSFAYAYNERGIAYSNSGQNRKAIPDYDKVIELLPDFFEVYYNKGLSCELLDRFPEAVAAYRKFVEIAPKSYREHIEYVKQRIAELSRGN